MTSTKAVAENHNRPIGTPSTIRSSYWPFLRSSVCVPVIALGRTHASNEMAAVRLSD